MSIFGLGHWIVHNCDEREERNNDDTIVIHKVWRKPDKGFPNMGQFQIKLREQGMMGFFINYCPYCTEDLRLKKDVDK